MKISKIALRSLISEMMLQEDDGQSRDQQPEDVTLGAGDRWGLGMDSVEMVELYHHIGDHFGNAQLKTVNEDTYALETNVITLRRYITALLRDDSSGGYYAEYGRPAAEDPTQDSGGVKAQLLDGIPADLKDEMISWIEETMPSVPDIVGAWERAAMDGPTVWSDIPILTNMGYSSPENDNPYVQIWRWIEAGWLPNIRPTTVELGRLEAESAEGDQTASVPETEDFRSAMTVTEAENLAQELVARFQPYYEDADDLAVKAEELFTGTVDVDPPCGTELEEFVNLIIEILNDPSRSGQSGLTFRMAAGLYADRTISPASEFYDDAGLPTAKFLGTLGGILVANYVFKKIPYFGPMYAGALTRFGSTRVGGQLFRNNWTKWALRGGAASAFTGVLALADNETGMFTALTLADSNELPENIGPDLDTGVDCHKLIEICDDYERCISLKAALYTFWDTLQTDSHGGGSGEFRLALTNNDLKNVLYVNLPQDIGIEMVAQSEEVIPESANYTSDLRGLISLLVNEGMYDDPRYANQDAENRADRRERPTLDDDSDGYNNAVDSDTTNINVWKLANHSRCTGTNPAPECWVPTGDVECSDGQQPSDDGRSCVDIPEAPETESEPEDIAATTTSTGTSDPDPPRLNDNQHAIQALQVALGVTVDEQPAPDGQFDNRTKRAWDRWIDALTTLEYRDLRRLAADGGSVTGIDDAILAMKNSWPATGREAAERLIGGSLNPHDIEAMIDFHEIVEDDIRGSESAVRAREERMDIASGRGGYGGGRIGMDASGHQVVLQPTAHYFSLMAATNQSGGSTLGRGASSTVPVSTTGPPPTIEELRAGVGASGRDPSLQVTLNRTDPAATLYITPGGGRSGHYDHLDVSNAVRNELLNAFVLATLQTGREGRGYNVSFNGDGRLLGGYYGGAAGGNIGGDWIRQRGALSRQIKSIVRRGTNVGERNFIITFSRPDSSYTRAGDFSSYQ